MSESRNQSRFFLPSWWVRAFDVIATSSGDQDPFTLAQKCRVLPCLNGSELLGVGVAIARLQGHLLAGSPCRISVSDHKKHSPVTNRSLEFGFARVLQLLPSLRLLAFSGHNGTPSGPIVNREEWLQIDNDTLLEVVLSDIGKFVVLGYAEGYYDLWWRHQYGVSLSELIGGRPPLTVSQSAWLELQGMEQLMFLRLEKAMQWQQNLVRLDGTFSLDFESLFDQLTVRTKQAGRSGFFQRMVLLQRLGRKLVDHGIIESVQNRDFLALDAREHSQLVWQVGCSQIFDHDSESYRIDVQKFLAKNYFRRAARDIVSLLSMDTLSSVRAAEWVAFVNKLTDSDNLPVFSQLVARDEANLILAGPLYLEWLVRLNPHHPFPLAENLVQSAPGLVVARQEYSVEALEAFVDAIMERSDLREDLITTSMACLASQVSYRDPSWRHVIQGQGREKPASLCATRSEDQSQRSKQVPAKESSGLNKLDLKKQAAQLLHKFRADDTPRYGELKRAYIDSLDDNSRRIITEVQKRLQPSIFEDHIRHSLIKFMVEHPEIWVGPTSVQ